MLDTRYPPIQSFLRGQLDVNVPGTSCGISAGAGAVVLSATVVPRRGLTYLTLWPTGESLPNVATLNAFDGQVTSNMAVVPTSAGSVSAWASDPTYLIIDTVGYFAP